MIGIVVTYHGEIDYLPKALHSIAAQTIPPSAVVVVNDAHPTCPLDLVKSFGYGYIRTGSNAGLADARNIGIAYLSAPYYIPLDADDRLTPDCVSTYTKVLARLGKRSIHHYLYSDLYMVQQSQSVWKSKPFDITALLKYNYISATSCVPKSVWEEVGGYDDDFSKLGGWEDWAFWLDAFDQAITGIHVPKPLFYRTIKEESMIKSIGKEQEEALMKLLRKKFSNLYEAQTR